MKNKETLEEAKINAVNKWVKGYNHLKLSDFEKNGIAVDFGNGWDKAIECQQQQQDKDKYSEEEVKQLLCQFDMSKGRDLPTKEFDEWFDKNKKK
jgi:hypothetical protein